MTGTKRVPKERGIDFMAKMVLAIIEGRKWKTRRLVKFPPGTYRPAGNVDWVQSVHQDGGGNWIAWSGNEPGLAEFTKRAYPNGEGFKCAYGRPGDRLWIREEWATERRYDQITGAELLMSPSPRIWYSDQLNRFLIASDGRGRRRRARFMPRDLSRLTLETTDVRCERLQDITEEEAVAEGITDPLPDDGLYWTGKGTALTDERNPAFRIEQAVNGYRGRFGLLWNMLHGKNHPWDSNPWVWVISFKVIEFKG